jgi:hypothetical protein
MAKCKPAHGVRFAGSVNLAVQAPYKKPLRLETLKILLIYSLSKHHLMKNDTGHENSQSIYSW